MIDDSLPYDLPKCNGIVQSISLAILNSAVREYGVFAAAAACQIVAAAAQGVYCLPDGRPLSLYQLLLAPASAGKGQYQGAVKKLVHEIYPVLLGGEPGSREGLRQDLHAWNVRLIVIDEVQDFLAKLTDDSNVHIKGISTDLKEVWSGTDKLQSISTKTSFSHELKHPRINFLGVGTVEGTGKSLSGSVVGGGLASRFNIFTAGTEMPARKKRQTWPLKCQDELSALRRLALEGMVEKPFIGMARYIELRMAYIKKPEDHEPQMIPEKRLAITPEASDLIWEHEQAWEMMLLRDPTSPEASIYDRAGTQALIYAAIHCIGRGYEKIDKEDVCFGTDMASLAAESACKLMLEHGATSNDEATHKRILRSLAKHGAQSKRDLQRSSTVWGAAFVKALEGAVNSGEVIMVDGKFRLA
jgi:hypothetical protein